MGIVPLRVAKYYIVIGIIFSAEENLRGLLTAKPTAFAWTGSVLQNLTLFTWWFLWPAITWPYEVYWILHAAMMKSHGGAP